MSNFLNSLKEDTNYGYTENGAIKHNTTLNDVLDLFALGGSYRQRSDDDIKELFGDAFREDPNLAIKCLFYLRDVRGGQGERRFFRVAYKWLIKNDVKCAVRNLPYISEYGRWDDLIDICYGTIVADNMFRIVKTQLETDLASKTPSLLAKWMPSENASNKETKEKARWFITKLNTTARDYRVTLSILRKRIKILEADMSANKWDDIEFDKIPSVAGMKYRHAFENRPETRYRYAEFMTQDSTKVNAAVLNPVNITDKILRNTCFNWRTNKAEFKGSDIDRASLCKYWDNLKDYYNGREENAIAVVDVSGSMTGTPMAAAIGMGAYIAEKSHGPFANHFITFSHDPELVEFKGDDIVDKIVRCAGADWGMNTNIEAVMDLLLDTAIKHHASQDDLPARLYIFSDMEFDYAIQNFSKYNGLNIEQKTNTLFEKIEEKWRDAGYTMPMITFWNLYARTNNIPAIGDRFNYISGFSMSQMEAVMAGKTSMDMMLEVLLSDRYAAVDWGGDSQ